MDPDLERVRMFQGIPLDGLTRLAERGNPRVFSIGSVLMRQGELADSMYIIATGRVRVERSHPDLLAPLILADLGPGEVVGEMGLVDGQPRSATVEALEDTETLELDAFDLSQVVLRYPEVSMALLQTISRRLRSIDELMTHMALRSQADERRRR
jgi:CRP/FNR family cyclic AMP-dependent transcriptional regulator